MFYLLRVVSTDTETVEHILEVRDDGSRHSFIASAENEHKSRFEAWLAEGNELTEWNPEVE